MRRFKKHIPILWSLALAFLLSACAGGQALSAASDEEPLLALWVALKAEEIRAADGAYTVRVSFGGGARDVDRYTVTVTSEDFEVTKTCPDEYVVDGVTYKPEDFYALPVRPVTYEQLPQRFTVSLLPNREEGLYSGQVEIAVREYLPGSSYGTAKVDLYYYGYHDLICFSTNSVQEAERRFLTAELF